MEHLTRILDGILAENRQQAEEIRRQTTCRANEILQAGEEKARQQREALLQQAQRETEEILKRGNARGRMESRSILLEAKGEALEQTFQRALEKLRGLPQEEKVALYGGFLGQWSRGSEVTAVLSREEKDLLGRRLMQEGKKQYGIQVSLAEEEGAFSGGLILREGKQETDCTFEGLLDFVKKDLKPEIAARLFSKSNQEGDR